MVALKIVSASLDQSLAVTIATRLGTTPVPRLIASFPDTESHVEIQQSVRGADLYVVQVGEMPVNESLVRLLFVGDACLRAGADRLTAVLSYFSYARQDRRAGAREPLGARVVAETLKAGGFQRVVAVDLHGSTLEGVFPMPLEHLSATLMLAEAVGRVSAERAVVVAPDLGAAKLAERYGRLLELPMAVILKTRLSGERVKALAVVGDVRGRMPVVVDDMISAGATVEAAVRAVRDKGSRKEAVVVATHALLVGPAVERLGRLGLSRIIVTDSVVGPADQRAGLPIETVSVAPLLAEAISRLHKGESLDDLISHS